jgi:hypothetical protein
LKRKKERKVFLDLSTFLQVGRDERSKRANPGVDTGEVGLSAALTPRDDTDELLGGGDDGAARVTLARVLSTGGETSAEHLLGNGEANGGVLAAASGACNNGHIDLAERGRATATLSSSTPGDC